MAVPAQYKYRVEPQGGEDAAGILGMIQRSQFGWNGVCVVNDNALHTFRQGFFGIYVTTQVVVGNGVFDADIMQGNAVIGSTLDPGYHPIHGTEIQFSTAGQAYLLLNRRTAT